MKNILVATDPSTASSNAAEYAARLATVTGARLTLMSASMPAPILKTAKHTHADLIVIGKTGARRKNGDSFGSTALALARRTDIPLLIVPPDAACDRISAIAVAGDTIRHGNPPVLRELMSTFGSRLYRFTVTGKAPTQTIQVSESDALHSPGQPFRLLYQVPVNSLLRHSIENFIEVNPIELLVAKPLPGLSPERWMLNGPGKDLLFAIRPPLLVLPLN
ncbi:MAG TPA: universal stress protein [Puia sp.]|nr:universal stress protein [Puia sp.]